MPWSGWDYLSMAGILVTVKYKNAHVKRERHPGGVLRGRIRQLDRMNWEYGVYPMLRQKTFFLKVRCTKDLNYVMIHMSQVILN